MACNEAGRDWTNQDQDRYRGGEGSVWLLWTRLWTSGFHKRPASVWIDELLSASQEGRGTLKYYRTVQPTVRFHHYTTELSTAWWENHKEHTDGVNKMDLLDAATNGEYSYHCVLNEWISGITWETFIRKTRAQRGRGTEPTI